MASTSGRGGAPVPRKTAVTDPSKRRGENHFDDFGEYMQVKMRKLAEQLDKPVPGTDAPPAIFAGVSIYVDGLTDPPNLVLRDLICKHGGDYQYYLVSTVTHIVTVNLPDAKVKMLKKERIVHPDWIVKSCERGELLPWHQFALYRGPLPSQRPLAFPAPPPAELASLAVPTPQSELAIGPLPLEPTAAPEVETVADLPDDDNDLDEEEGVAPMQEDAPEDDVDDHGGWTSAMMGRSMVEREAAAFRSDWVQQNISTHPDFLARYFASSRLHFLSTWKNEFTKLVGDIMTKRSLATTTTATVAPPSKRRVIFHVDMDCFFVSVGIRDRPHLRNMPVGVSHSKGAMEAASAEIASCNYIARQFGVSNGMILASARKRCPNLVLIPYEFDKYKQVSEELYKVFLEFADNVQAVSCDEALLDVSSRVVDADQTLGHAQKIREAIAQRTGCQASIGAAHNILLAKLSTRKAKPNGQYFLAPDHVDELLLSTAVGDLPSVGWSLRSQLEELGVHTVKDLRDWTRDGLQRRLGQKVGETLYNFARGIDDRPLAGIQPRKTVGAEVNWGIRFEEEHQVAKFLTDLAAEVAKRMREAGAVGRTITLKEKKRRLDWEAPRKFLGCGPCDNFSKSVSLATATCDTAVIARECIALHDAVKIAPIDLRGVGIHVSRLDSAERRPRTDAKAVGGNVPLAESFRAAARARPAPNDDPAALDLDVFQSLPADVQDEIASGYRLTVDALLAALGAPARPSLAGASALAHAAAPPTGSKVDPSILSELPADIRDEVIRASSKPLSAHTEDDGGLADPADDIDLLTESIDSVRQQLQAWVANSGAPSSDDVAYVSRFLVASVRGGNTELAYLAVRSLQRTVQEGSCGSAWKEAVQQCVNALQAEAVRRHGKPLRLS